MLSIIVILFFFVATTSSFFIAPTSRSFVAFSSPRCTTSLLRTSSESSDKEKVPEPLKTEQFNEEIQFSDPPAKEEWKDPIAVAAEGKSPFADLFPGGLKGGNILNFALYGYVGYLLLDSVRILVVNYQPPP